MILIVANLLLSAYDFSSAHHEKSAEMVGERICSSGAHRVGLASILVFLRIATDPRLRGQPFLPSKAVAIVQAWMEQPNVRLLAPGERHWSILAHLLPEAQARGPLVMDAHLAALAIEHGATLCTKDLDFRRFAGLKVDYPLSSNYAASCLVGTPVLLHWLCAAWPRPRSRRLSESSTKQLSLSPKKLPKAGNTARFHRRFSNREER